MVRYEIYKEPGELCEWRECSSATEARTRLLLLGFIPELISATLIVWGKGDAYTAVIVPITDDDELPS
jgi:hypothetical protein